MKTTKYIFGALMLVALSFIVSAGCSRENLAEPEPYHVWSQAEIEEQGYTFMSIWEFKQKYFYSIYGASGISGIASTTIPAEDKVAIKGKVISTDQPGNIYRSIYIQDISASADGTDTSGALEIKVGATGLYNDYKVGQTIYIKCDELVLGNYRYNLSLGAVSEDTSYSNGYIDLKKDIERAILRGAQGGFTSQDTIRVTKDNVATALRDPQDLGRIVRFEGIRSKWGTPPSGTDGFSNTDIYPAFLQSIPAGKVTNYVNWYLRFLPTPGAGEPEPSNYYITDENGNKRYYVWTDGTSNPRYWPNRSGDSLLPAYPTWAFHDWGHSYYGSALFELGGKYYVIRSSGYALFALVKLPEDGVEADITAMYNKYASGSGGFMKYQLLLNSSNDVVKPGTNQPLHFFDRNENVW